MKLAPQFWLLLVATVLVNLLVWWWSRWISSDEIVEIVKMGLCFIQITMLGAWLVVGNAGLPIRTILVGLGVAAWVGALYLEMPRLLALALGVVMIQLVPGIVTGLVWRWRGFRWRNLLQSTHLNPKSLRRPRQFSLATLLGLTTVCAVVITVGKQAEFPYYQLFELAFVLAINASIVGLGLGSLKSERRSPRRPVVILALSLLSGFVFAFLSGRGGQLLTAIVMFLISAIFVIIWVEVCRSAQLRLVRVDAASDPPPTLGDGAGES